MAAGMRDRSASRFPVDPWKIREQDFDPGFAGLGETVFALGNGHLGVRGNFEEGARTVASGTYINGFFEETPIIYGEIAYGYAKNRQVMVNVADAKVIRLFIDDEMLDVSSARLLAYERSLDLREGVLVRSLRWRSPRGSVVEVGFRRLVSLGRRHVAALECAVTVREGTARLRFESAIEADVPNAAAGSDPRVGSHFRDRPLRTTGAQAAGRSLRLTQETRNTRFALACCVDHDVALSPGLEAEERCETRADAAALHLSVEAPAGSTVRLTKYVGYCTSRELPSGEAGAGAALPAAEGLAGAAQGAAQVATEASAAARLAGFAALCAEQRDYLHDFWARADVRIEGDEGLQQGLRFNIWSLLQSAGRDGRTSLAAKGLTGQGYEGHYFWDTEIYAIPFFVYTSPEIARALLLYRVRLLDKARARAAEMSQRGALYPWRTIGGEETSPYFPAGTAQYHINADIVHALRVYLQATGDRGILRVGGAEMVFETARLWADLGDFLPTKDGEFSINEVTGPDEYSALVDNNLYTNMMAREHLQFAAALADELASGDPLEYERIARAISLERAEVDGWREAARRMRIPYDRARGIHAQDERFLSRARWDFESTPPESHPLLLHYHPLVIYRYQVLKQPDVVLAQVLLRERFSAADRKRNYDYYNPLTTGDSSLSPCIQSVAAADLGYTEEAHRYFSRTARMDLDDVNGNSSDGVHVAAMAGTWISLVYGFAGMRDAGGTLSFSPRLPSRWTRLSFRLVHRGRTLEVTVTHDEATYLLVDGDEMSLVHRGRDVSLRRGVPASFSLAPALECVIFDLDGVLTDTAELHFRAWKRCAEELRLPFDRAVNERLKGVGRMESLDIILENAGQSMPGPEKTVIAERKNGYYRELIGSLGPGDLLPGIAVLLRKLREAGIRTAIASASRNAAQVVARLAIGPLIDVVVDPATVVKGKPDPEVFLAAAEALHAPVENCIGIEDSQAGIDAIRAAGMFSVAVGGKLTGADWTVAGTEEITAESLTAAFLRTWPAGRGPSARSA